jgi:hypothetical protein
MSRVWTCLRLPIEDRDLMLASVLALGLVRFAMWRLPVETSMRLVRRWSRHGPGRRRAPPSPERIAWAITIAGRLLPSAKCLPRALAAHLLLRRCAHPSTLRIGIAAAQDRCLGHAWVEVRGRVVVGGLPDLHRYRPLPTSPPGGLIGALGFYLLHQQRSRAPP